MSHYWFFAAGGTGRRVALAMLHMCAAGALADDTLHIRYIDTDDEEKKQPLPNTIRTAPPEWFITLREQHERYDKLHEIFKGGKNLFSCEIDYPDEDTQKSWAKMISNLWGVDLKDKTIREAYNDGNCPHILEEKLLIQALLGSEITTNTKPFCGLCAAPNAGALLLRSRIDENPELQNFFGVVGADAEKDFNDKHAKIPGSPSGYDPKKKYDPSKEYNEDHPIAFLASSFGGTGAAFLPAVRQQLKAKKAPKRCAMLFLDQYFTLYNWTEALFEKKQKAMKKYLQEHHGDEHHILPCLEEGGIRDRGRHADKEQKNWPSETEYLAAILLCSFFRNKNFNWKVNPKDDMNGDLRDLKERYRAFDKLAQCWCHDFEGSKITDDTDSVIKWCAGASWMGRIPKKTREKWREGSGFHCKFLFPLLNIINRPFGTQWPQKYYEDEPTATLEDPTLEEFMKDWLRWQRQINNEYKAYEESEHPYGTSFAPEVLDEAAADACWRKASTMVNERKAELVNDLFEECRKFVIERA